MGLAVDVVIAARNEGAMLGRCLEALRSQDYPAELVQVFVCDDRSRDDTVAVAMAAGATVVRGESPGPAAARNAGIRAGRAPLVAFLDAHVIPARNWLSALAPTFEDRQVGGCQARLISRAADPRVDRFVQQALDYSADALTRQTVSGTRTLYPWLLTGNSMYRREALDAAGLFDERFRACEDVDLGWRVVLAGYLLTATSDTDAIHIEGRSWTRFLTKGWTYGRGGAQVARAYVLHGTSLRGTAASARGGLAAAVAAVCYASGYWVERMLPRSSRGPAQRPLPQIHRDACAWTPRETLTLTPSVVYWFGGDTTTIVVNVATRQRVVLDGAGNLIWRRLTRAGSRSSIVQALIDTYGIARRTAECDLDDLIDELAELAIVRRDQISLGP